MASSDTALLFRFSILFRLLSTITAREKFMTLFAADKNELPGLVVFAADAATAPAQSSIPDLRSLLTPDVMILLGFLVVIGFLATIGSVPVRYNIRNIAVRWRTTLLTALAFTLVASLMTVMLAFVSGLNKVTGQSGRPDNVLVLADGSTDEQFSNLGFVDAGDVSQQPGIARNERDQALCSEELYLVVNQMSNVAQGRQRRRFLQLRGIESPEIAAAVRGFELRPGGSWFSTAGVEESKNTADGQSLIQVVVGEGLAGELGADTPGRKPLVVGDTFELGPRTWKIVGIMASGGSINDSEIWAKRSLVGPLFGKDSISTMLLRCTSAAEAERLTTFLKTDYKKAALATYVESKYYASQNQFADALLFCVVFVTFFMALGGVFGVMNTMFAAISQRSRDIGVMRILGYSRVHILISFLLESLVIALIGGLLGCIVGSFADGLSAKSIVSGGGGGGKTVVLQLLVDYHIIVWCLVLSLGMGFIGGLFPAVSAMRLRALESMR